MQCVQIVYQVLILQRSALALPIAFGVLVRGLGTTVFLLHSAQLAHRPFPKHTRRSIKVGSSKQAPVIHSA
jgi:hypothetical protein